MTTTYRRLHELNHSYLRRVARSIEKAVRRSAREGETRYVVTNPPRHFVDPETLCILRYALPGCYVGYVTGALIISWE